MRTLGLARHLGVSRDWIIAMERKGLIPPPARDRNGHRRFDQKDIERIRALIYGPGQQTGDRKAG